MIEKILPFKIKRVFYIYNVDDSIRGKHRHIKTIQAAICISGSCVISCKSSKKDKMKYYKLSKPDQCLIIYPEDYHTMQEFSKDAVLLVLHLNIMTLKIIYMKNINFFNFDYTNSLMRNELINSYTNFLDSNYYVLGENVKKFGSRICKNFLMLNIVQVYQMV